MTSLRAFQTEIDEIHAREVLKQRAHGSVTKEKEHTKLKQAPFDTKLPVKKDHGPVPPQKIVEAKATVKGTTAAADVNKIASVEVESGTKETAATPSVKQGESGGDDATSGQEAEDLEIQKLLLSRTPADLNRARDMVAALLTRHRGEHIFRLGLRPTNARLFGGQPANHDIDGWAGIDRTDEELTTLKEELTRAVEEVGGKVCVLHETRNDHVRAALLLRLPPLDVSLTPEVRIAVVGNVDAGKSSFLGVLTRGALDDGRGRARVGLFRHKHEIETGRTSSVGMEILGFAPSGEPILPNTAVSNDPETIRREKLGWEAISLQAAKIVSFIDLAGHERYLKTTLYGLTSGAPSCVILIVGANAGLIGMSKEHLAIALALGVPVVVCITKTDMTPPNIQAETIKQVVKIMRSPGCRKTPVFVRSHETAVEISQSFAKDRLCPIFQISNVTGEGLDFVRTFLNLLPSSDGDKEKFTIDQPLEYSVTEVWSVPYVGTVVNGLVYSGVVKVGEPVLLGPDSNGNYQPTVIKTMQRKRAPVTSAEAGQCVSFALKRIRKAAVRKGMVIVNKSDNPPKVSRQFEGQVLILYHNTTLQKNYQAMLHCGAIRQTVRIIGIDHPQGLLRTGDRATVQFEFISHPEYIKEGMKLLFREGKTKGLGVITRLL